MRNESVDWHPGSNETVRDIIHPSMYPYVKEGVDESLMYQWLPSEFNIGIDGSTKVSSYVNNLNNVRYPDFIPCIETMFSEFLPSLEKVTGRNLRNVRLQVIIKVGSTILSHEHPEYDGGSWHIEGMPYEHIMATCLHYLDVRGITDSFLEFRKPVILNNKNIEYPQNGSKHTTYHFGIEPNSHHDGKMNRYLGLIKSVEGASVVFPNTLQHRVKEFKMRNRVHSGRRSIIAFFVVDPDHRIVSTADIPEQQETMKLEDALNHRLRLMYHRKFFVDKLNSEVFERPYSLCEH